MRKIDADSLTQEFDELGDEVRIRVVDIKNFIKREPTVQEYAAYWIKHIEARGGEKYECATCHTRQASSSPYCPQCGKPMKDIKLNYIPKGE